MHTYNFSVILDDNDESCGVRIEDTLQVRLLHIPLVLCRQLIEALDVTAPHWPDSVVDVVVFCPVEVEQCI